MKTFNEFIKTSSGSLFIFDIDETLFKTSAKVMVHKLDGTVVALSNQQFNDYVLADGEKFDFSEFKSSSKFASESIPIDTMISTVIRIQQKIKLGLIKGKVILNTAREDFDNKDEFLGKFTSHGVDTDLLHVHRAGNVPGSHPPALKKLIYIRQYLSTGKFASAQMYDDSKTNLKAFKTLESEFPAVTFHAWLIDHSGMMKHFGG